MTASQIRSRWAPAVAAAVLVLAPPAARADEARSRSDPWYQQSSAEARRQAQALFEQALDKHLQLLRHDAKELYEQALALWDNPDIRWNLALVLDDLGEYLLAHQQLSSMLRWRAALGGRRLREVQDLMQALETRRLARLEAYGGEAGAQIELDGKPWFTGAGGRTELVGPGEHYISASKPGYFSVTVPVFVTTGLEAHVALEMDADRLIETRRWAWWKPWAVVGAGATITAVGGVLEVLAFAQQSTAASSVASSCPRPPCNPIRPAIYDSAVAKNREAIDALVLGGSAITVGLVLVWLNHTVRYRTEPRSRSTIRFTPIVSPQWTGASAVIRL